MSRSTFLHLRSLFVLILSGCHPIQAPQDSRPADRLTPIILFPGWGGTRLEVSVDNQTVAPECPTSGTFEYTFFPDHPSTEFTQMCQDKLLTLVYNFDPQQPAVAEGNPAWVVSEQPVCRWKCWIMARRRVPWVRAPVCLSGEGWRRAQRQHPGCWL